MTQYERNSKLGLKLKLSRHLIHFVLEYNHTNQSCLPPPSSATLLCAQLSEPVLPLPPSV
jgi:hypothetical protein